MSHFAALAGLVRSLAIYLGRPDRTRAQARFYAALLSPGDLAFDIGAHMGNRSRALHRAGARVVALEPQKVCLRVLRLTLPRAVVLVPKAVGAEPGTAELQVAPRHPTVTTLSTSFRQDAAALPGFGHVDWSETQTVEVTTLDALIAARGVPAYIKIDVEGHEAAVLSGLSQPVALVSVEVIPGMVDRFEAAVDRLEALGTYQFNVARGEEAVFLFDDWMDRAAVVAWLSALAPGSKPCDVYARLTG